MILLRKVLFCLFFLFFLVCAPIIVMYALGYLFRSGEVPEFVKTGLVYIATVPKEAEIYIGKNRFDVTTPTTIRDLVPGEYTIRVNQKGYQPWMRTVVISSGHATVLDKIILVPLDNRSIAFDEQIFKQMWPLTDTAWLLMEKGERLDGLSLFDTEKVKDFPLVKPEYPLAQNKVERLFMVKDSTTVVLQLKGEKGSRFLWFKLKEEPELKDISSLFYQTPENLQWSPNDPESLFVYQKGSLNKLVVRSSTVYPEFFKDIYGFGIYQRNLYVLNHSGKFFRTDIEGKSRKALVDDPSLFQKLFNEQSFIKIEILSKTLILFLQADGRLVSNRIPYEFVKEGVVDFAYHAKSKKVLLWLKNRVGMINFSEDRAAEIFENTPQIEWLYSEGRNIEQSFWVYDDSHILFRDENKVFLLETDPPGKGHLYPLAVVKKGSRVHYSEAQGMLYYLDEETSALHRLEVLPKKELGFLTLPEFEEKVPALPGPS